VTETAATPAKPARQREIVDRLALFERLAALAEDGEPDRRKIVEAL